MLSDATVGSPGRPSVIAGSIVDVISKKFKSGDPAAQASWRLSCKYARMTRPAGSTGRWRSVLAPIATQNGGIHDDKSLSRGLYRHGGGAVTSWTAVPARAQTDPNPGSITLTAGGRCADGVFFPRHPSGDRTGDHLLPYGDLGLALYSGDGGVKSASVNLGVWNSVQTGSSGSDGPLEIAI